MVSVPVLAQDILVKGKVIDQDGQNVLAGATVNVKDTQTWTTTDNDGFYSIRAKSNSILVFSFLGYQTKEIKVGNSSTIDMSLEPEVSSLDAVVLVGYGQQKKASVVGAISTVTAEELKQSASANLSNAIAGRISGVMTKMVSGRPGADESRILIRGQATTNNSTPLTIVDGVEGDFTQIDPDDIESFSVMKDASATAVYGVRGANGVIIVTTKRGTKQKPVVSLNSSVSMQTPIRLPKPLDAYNFALLKNEAIRNDGGSTTQYAYSTEEDLERYRLGDSPYTHPDNDLLGMFLKKYIPQYQVNMSVRGGSDLLKYFVSANYLYQDGIYTSSDNGRYSTNANFQRINLRSNLDFSVTKTTTLSIDFSSSFRDKHNIGLQNRFAFDNGPESNNLFELLMRQPANYMALRNPDGSYGAGMVPISSQGAMRNPLQVIERGGYYHVDQNVVSGMIRLRQKLDMVTKGLSANAMVKVNSLVANSETLSELPATREYNKYGEYTSTYSQEVLPSLSYQMINDWVRIYSEVSLNYARNLGSHEITALALYNQTNYVAQGAVPNGYLGFVGRVTYGYKNRYLAEVNLGYNGSNQFAKGRRYALFPAFSAGWVISQENFWKENVKVVNHLKFRGSWGMVGNDKLGGYQYLYLQVYNKGNANYGNYGFGTTHQGVTGWTEGVLGNDRVTWEKARKFNVGFDMRVFSSRFSLSADYFREMRTDILMKDNSIPSVIGIGTPPSNIGRILNQGGEIEASYKGSVKDFNYHILGNVSYARNKILFQGEPKQAYPWMARTGQSLGQHFGLVSDGLFMSQEEIDNAPVQFGKVQIGDIRYVDLNNDGVINSYDECPIGYSNIPRWQFGLTLGFDYKGFDFSMLWQGAAQFTAYFDYGAVWEFMDNGNVQEFHLGRFNPEDESTWSTATYPRLHNGNFPNNHRKSDYWTRKGDYLRLKNLEIGYTLPKKLAGKMRMSNLRVYLSGTNLLTFDYVKIFDPETENTRGYNYPQMALYTFGVNFQF